jgi:hypothetical protein
MASLGQVLTSFRMLRSMPVFPPPAIVLALLASGGSDFRMVPDAIGAPPSEQGPSVPQPVLQFHLAETESIPGVSAVVVPAGNLRLWPRPATILSEADVDSAIAGYGDFALQIQLKLNAEGRRRVREVTRANVGRHVVVFLAGEFIMAPMIMAEIDSDALVIDSPDHTEEQWDGFFDQLAGAGVGVVRFAETPGEVGQDLPTPEETHRQLLAGWDYMRDRLDALEGRYSQIHLGFVRPMGELAMILRLDYDEIDTAREIILRMEEIVRARLGQDREDLISPLYSTLADLCDVDQYERAESLLFAFLSEIAKPEWQKRVLQRPPEFFIRPLANHWVEEGQIERAERLYEAVLSGPFWIARPAFDPYLRFVEARKRGESLQRQSQEWQARAETDTLYGEAWRQMAEKGQEALEDMKTTRAETR